MQVLSKLFPIVALSTPAWLPLVKSNIWVGLTSFALIPSAIKSFKRKDFISFGLQAGLMVVSLMSHLVENHQHCPKGIIQVSATASKCWMCGDITFACMLLARIIQLFAVRETTLRVDCDLWMLACSTLVVGGLADRRPLDGSTSWLDDHYYPLHCLWHVQFSRLVYKLLSAVAHD